MCDCRVESLLLKMILRLQTESIIAIKTYIVQKYQRYTYYILSTKVFHVFSMPPLFFFFECFFCNTNTKKKKRKLFCVCNFFKTTDCNINIVKSEECEEYVYNETTIQSHYTANYGCGCTIFIYFVCCLSQEMFFKKKAHCTNKQSIHAKHTHTRTHTMSHIHTQTQLQTEYSHTKHERSLLQTPTNSPTIVPTNVPSFVFFVLF